MRRWVRLFLGLSLVAFLAFAVYVRVASVDVVRMHSQTYPSGIGERVTSNGMRWFEYQQGDGVAQMAALDQVILATPRTTQVAGSLESGMVTYVTRSALFRFPDYTTVWRDAELIEGGGPALGIYGRARFGLSDLGVNKRRIRAWLAAVKAGG